MQASTFFTSAAAVAALSLSMVSGHALAAPWTFAGSGTIQSGYDMSGLFGDASNDLYGKSYAISVAIDPLLYQNHDGGSGFFNYWGAQSGSISATVTVGSVTQAFDVDMSKFNWGTSYMEAGPGMHRTYQHLWATTSNGYTLNAMMHVSSETNQFLNGIAPQQTASYQSAPSDAGYAYFNLSGNGAQVHLDGGIPAVVSINAASDVPEPAAPALFALALFACGIARRRA